MSFLVTPDPNSAATVANALRATVQMPAFLMVALVSRWLRDGSAEAIISAIRDEAIARQKLAANVLARHVYAAHPNGHHLWLPLPRKWNRAEFASHMYRQGLAIVTAESFAVEENPTQAIRVALGAANSRSELVGALEVLANALKTSVGRTHIV